MDSLIIPMVFIAFGLPVYLEWLVLVVVVCLVVIVVLRRKPVSERKTNSESQNGSEAQHGASEPSSHLAQGRGTLNTPQKVMIVIGIAVALGFTAYPPSVSEFTAPRFSRYERDRSVLWNIPQRYRIDFGRLALEETLVLVLTAGIVWLLKSRR